jgi:hypothetical protein
MDSGVNVLAQWLGFANEPHLLAGSQGEAISLSGANNTSK